MYLSRNQTIWWLIGPDATLIQTLFLQQSLVPNIWEPLWNFSPCSCQIYRWIYLFISSVGRITGFGVYVWRNHSLQNISKVFIPVELWGHIKVISIWPNPQRGTEQQRLINAHNCSSFRFEECVSSTSFSWSVRWQPLLTKHILHLHIDLASTSSAYRDFFYFQNLGILCVTTLQLLCKLKMIHPNWLGLAKQSTAKRISRCTCEWVGGSKSRAPMITPKQVAHSLAIAKQKAPYNYSSCYISFPRDSFRCKFIYRGGWDEMCNRHTWLTRILYL